jgi:hypothetical protein
MEILKQKENKFSNKPRFFLLNTINYQLSSGDKN